MIKDKLHFGLGNSKLSTAIGIFDLPAGWTCPQANECLCRANPLTGRVKDGPNTKFRCYAASLECVFRNTRNSRWRNLNLLKKAGSIGEMANLIQNSLPEGFNFIRVHSSGDFFNERYFLAWLNVAINNPIIVFYGYTKTLDLFIKYKKYIPSNFRFTASKGGKLDWMISRHHMKYAEVVFSTEEAAQKGLEIDHDDSHAIMSKQQCGSFALLLHGCQPQGTVAATAVHKLKKQGLGMYGKGTKKEKVFKSVKLHVTLRDGAIYLPIVSFGEEVKFKPKIKKTHAHR